jgi:beta-lactam-binding protein with PASTA domain
MAVDTAKAQAEDLGLVVELQKRWPWSSPNAIVDQSIAPGTDVEVGTKIVLTYN